MFKPQVMYQPVITRVLMQVEDDQGSGARQAALSLRLPSLRLHLKQPTLAFLWVCCCAILP